MKYKTYDLESIKVYTLKTDKFKNAYLEINFRNDMEDAKPYQRNFLNGVMLYNSKSYPTKRDLAIASEELYDVSLSGTLNRVGKNLITTFNMDLLDPRFVKEKDYLEKCFAFFFDILSNPNVIDGVWQEEAFEVIKQRLHINIDSVKEKPVSFATIMALQTLFPNSYSGKRLIGTHEDIDSVTRESLYEEYLDMLQNSLCEITVVGNLDMDEVMKLIQKYFHKPSIVQKDIPSVIINPINKPTEKYVRFYYNQTVLSIIYQLEELSDYERNFVVPLFNRLFGYGNLTDKLGKYLRMENSLCYSYRSNFVLKDSYCLITTGLKKENARDAVTYIKKAMQEMADGDFLEEELETIKKKFLSDMRLQQDSIYMLVDNYYNHEVFNKATYEEYIEKIPKVTKKEIKEIAKKMHLTFAYVMEEAKQ